jgi:hypothetical protein
MKPVATGNEIERQSESLLRRNLLLLGGYLAVLTLIATAYL